MQNDGERLPGGYLNGAVRIGNTVRRTAGPWTPNVHALLDHLRQAGFNYAPKPLGIDDQGREVLEYVAGDTIGDAYPWPDWVWSESLLAEVGTAVAELHAAAADFRVPETATWQFASGAPADGEILSHFDLAPYNVVVRDGRLAAFIDWDLARPLRAWDEVAFVAWEWVPLWHPESARGLGWTSPPDLKRRLDILLEHYGAVHRTGFIDRVIESVDLRAEEITRHANEGVTGYVRLVAEGQVANIVRTSEYLRANRDQLRATLGT
jgi:hypothetical protein